MTHDAAPSSTCTVAHIKPGEMEDAVMTEIGQLGSPHRIHALQAGQVLELTGL